MSGISKKAVIELSKKGSRLFRNGQLDEAEKVYLEAKAIDEENPYVLSGLGDVYRKLNRFEESGAQYDAVLKKDPNNIFALRGAGDARRGMKQPQSAIPFWLRYLEINEKDSHVMVRIADARQHQDLRRIDRAAAQDHLLAEEVGLGLVFEGRLDDAGSGAADGMGVDACGGEQLPVLVELGVDEGSDVAVLVHLGLGQREDQVFWCVFFSVAQSFLIYRSNTYGVIHAHFFENEFPGKRSRAQDQWGRQSRGDNRVESVLAKRDTASMRIILPAMGMSSRKRSQRARPRSV